MTLKTLVFLPYVYHCIQCRIKFTNLGAESIANSDHLLWILASWCRSSLVCHFECYSLSLYHYYFWFSLT